MIIFVDRFLRLFSGLLFTIFLSKLLPIDLYGKYSYYLSVLSILSCIASFGLDDAIKKFYLTDETKVNAVKLCVCIKFLLSILLSSSFIFYCYMTNENIWVYLFSFYIFNSFTSFFFNLSLISNKIKIVSSISIILNIIFSIFKILSIYYYNLTTYILFQLIECLFLFLFFVKIFNINIFQLVWDKDLLLKILSSAWPLFLSSLAIIGYYKIDQIIITYYLGFDSNAIYSLASQFIISAGFIHGILINVAFKKIFELRGDDTSLSNVMKKYYSYSTCGTLLILSGVWFVFKPLFIHIWSEQFYLVPNMVFFGVCGLLFSGIGMLQTQKLISVGLEKYRMYRVFLAFFVI